MSKSLRTTWLLSATNSNSVAQCKCVCFVLRVTIGVTPNRYLRIFFNGSHSSQITYYSLQCLEQCAYNKDSTINATNAWKIQLFKKDLVWNCSQNRVTWKAYHFCWKVESDKFVGWLTKFLIHLTINLPRKSVLLHLWLVTFFLICATCPTHFVIIHCYF